MHTLRRGVFLQISGVPFRGHPVLNAVRMASRLSLCVGGLIVYAYNNEVNGCYIGYAPNDSTSRPITVEATDDGNRLGQYAAMGIAYMSDDGNFDDGVGELTVSSDKIFIGQTGKALYMSTPTSYVLRELQGDFDEDEDGGK